MPVSKMWVFDYGQTIFDVQLSIYKTRDFPPGHDYFEPVSGRFDSLGKAIEFAERNRVYSHARYPLTIVRPNTCLHLDAGQDCPPEAFTNPELCFSTWPGTTSSPRQ